MNTESTNVPELESGSGARQVLIAGVVLGLSGNYLLWFGPRGPGFVVWTILLAAAVLWINRHVGIQRFKFLLLWTGVAVLASLMLTLRATPFLLPIMGLVMLLAAAMTLLQTRKVSLMATRVADFIAALFATALRAGFGAIPVLSMVDFSVNIPYPRLLGITRGLLLSVPLLVLFIGLFANADARFGSYVMGITDLFSESTLRHLVWTCVFTWVATGFLSCADARLLGPARTPPTLPKLGVEETTVILALLSTVFLLFVLVQLNYLFGGRATIEATSGLTLAEYARRGFFELVLVAGLTLALLLALGSGSAGQRWFRLLANVMVGCVLVILASAAQRFQLYIEQFGLTLDRLIAVALMVWLAFSLLLFALTVLRERAEGFASVTALGGVMIALLLAMANPASIVAGVNIDRVIQLSVRDTARNSSLPLGSRGFPRLDIAYLSRLGNDAVPLLFSRLDELPPEYQCWLARTLGDVPRSATWNKLSITDWRSRNRADREAWAARNENADKIKQLAMSCPPDRLIHPLIGYPQ